jgi:hypothetical protein
VLKIPENSDSKIKSVIERLNSKLTINGDCWEWEGYRDKNGYGEIWFGNANYRIPRIVCHLTQGMPLDSKNQVRHTCDNPSCFNPEHLVQGSAMDNRRDSQKRRRFNGNKGFRKDHFKCGHPFISENIRPIHGSRECKICANKRDRDRRKKTQ